MLCLDTPFVEINGDNYEEFLHLNSSRDYTIEVVDFKVDPTDLQRYSARITIGEKIGICNENSTSFNTVYTTNSNPFVQIKVELFSFKNMKYQNINEITKSWLLTLQCSSKPSKILRDYQIVKGGGYHRIIN